MTTPVPTPQILPITNDNIHDVSALYMAQPEEAEARYGPIEDWDTSDVQDVAYLFTVPSLSIPT